MDTYAMFVLHSPYPDGSWRGLEKCAGTEESDGPLLFHTREDAQLYMQVHRMEEFFRVVEISVVTPSVRDPLGG